MAWRTRRSTRSSFGGSSTYHSGSLEPPDNAAEHAPVPDTPTGKTRLRTSAKEEELQRARQAGATPEQIRALIGWLEQLAARLAPGQLLDWSVRFESRERALCLRWRLRTPTAAETSLPWQTRRFGGKGGDRASGGRTGSDRGFR